jgi:glutamate-1-semialdehyde 2,1-aminomutase
MTTKNIILIQARSNSHRFPNKIIQKINNLSLLEMLISRLKKTKRISKIILCTTNNREDIFLKKIAKKNKIFFFQGSETNVLKRLYDASKLFDADNYIRITADCPFIDPEIIENILNLHIEKKLDYCSNTIHPTFPDGLDVEVITKDTLTKTYKKAQSKYDREHVTTYIKNNKKFKKLNFYNSENHSHLRLTVDYLEDLDLVKKIINISNNNIYINYKKIINIFKKNKSLMLINNMHLRNEGSTRSKSQKLWNQAKSIIPGGNSLFSKRPEIFLPGFWPTYFTKTKDNYVWDLEKKKYLDMSFMGVGTNFLGYSNSEIDKQVIKNIKKGNLSTLNPPEEVYLAKKLLVINKWAGMVKFARTGGEANTIALRIARASANKNKVLFCGYHGWHDWYLSSGKKVLKNYLFENVKTEGVIKNLKKQVLCFDFNNLGQFKNIIKKNDDIGIVFMEVARKTYPTKKFLKEIRNICDKKKIILIFDECTTGFREEFGGLHKKYNINPDIVVYGKTLGNGYAINAIVGKKEIMVKANNSFISSTFWTERIGFTAANKFLEIIEKKKPWKSVLSKGRYIKKMIKIFAKKLNLNMSVNGIDTIPSFEFNYKENLEYKTYITQEMLKNRILASNSIYLTSTHTDAQIKRYLNLLFKCFTNIKNFERNKIKFNVFLDSLPRSSGMRNS